MLEKNSDKIKNLISNVLPPDFYRRNTLEVARDLLGKVVVSQANPGLSPDHPDAGITAGRIVETEAYRADDPASHSARGKTPRSALMFGEPGFAYVYFIYGMYEMLNFVTEPADHPGAVLIRALEPVLGLELMARRFEVRSKTKSSQARSGAMRLTQGPGRLCRALGIRMAHNGQPLSGPALFVCDDGYRPEFVSQSERVGITLGKDKPWRYFVSNHPYVSRAPQNKNALQIIN